MLSAIQISKKFKDRIILNETSCEFEKGKSYAIIGRSGAGKTTFLNILGGLEQPDSGKICISGKEVNEKNIDKLRRDILGYIFQNFGLIDNDSVKSNLSVGIKHKKIPESQKIKLMHEVLEQFEIFRFRTKSLYFKWRRAAENSLGAHNLETTSNNFCR